MPYHCNIMTGHDLPHGHGPTVLVVTAPCSRANRSAGKKGTRGHHPKLVWLQLQLAIPFFRLNCKAHRCMDTICADAIQVCRTMGCCIWVIYYGLAVALAGVYSYILATRLTTASLDWQTSQLYWYTAIRVSEIAGDSSDHPLRGYYLTLRNVIKIHE